MVRASAIQLIQMKYTFEMIIFLIKRLGLSGSWLNYNITGADTRIECDKDEDCLSAEKECGSMCAIV